MTEPICVRCSGTVVRVEQSEGRFAVAAEINDYEFVADEKQSLVASGDASRIL
jgi:hypothetical protein